MVRESDVQIYSIGIFDQYAPTREEQLGPILLHDVSEETGGQLFRVDDLADMADIATKISAELRNQYVLGYKSEDAKRDGKWRKLEGAKAGSARGSAPARPFTPRTGLLCALAVVGSPILLVVSAGQGQPGRRRAKPRAPLGSRLLRPHSRRNSCRSMSIVTPLPPLISLRSPRLRRLKPVR